VQKIIGEMIKLFFTRCTGHLNSTALQHCTDEFIRRIILKRRMNSSVQKPLITVNQSR